MKLSSTLVRRTLDQIDAHAIPDSHPVAARLYDLFGEHTFFLDRKGLNIIEPTEDSDSTRQSAQVINLADWKDPEQTSLEAHDPEPTDVFVELQNDDERPIGGARVNH